MKIRIISSRDEIENLNPDEEMVHLRFRPSNVDLICLTQRCPELRAVRMSLTHHKTLSNAIRAFVDMRGIELLAGNVRGYRKDQIGYLTVDDTTEKKILALAKKRHSGGRDCWSDQGRDRAWLRLHQVRDDQKKVKTLAALVQSYL